MRGRVGMVWHPNAFSDSGRQLYQECNLFIVIVHYHIDPYIYKHLADFIEATDMRLETKLISITRSSLILQTEIIGEKSNKVLAWLRFKYVCVDRETRKSTPVPQWFVEKVKDKIEPGLTLAYEPPVIPENGTYTKLYTIIPSDIDWNGHTNNTVYYRLFFDVATEASVKHNLFTLLQGDICDYNICDSQAIYARESRMWDNIQITVWQDLKNVKTLHCHIGKEEVTLFKSTITFYVSTYAKL